MPLTNHDLAASTWMYCNDMCYVCLYCFCFAHVPQLMQLLSWSCCLYLLCKHHILQSLYEPCPEYNYRVFANSPVCECTTCHLVLVQDSSWLSEIFWCNMPRCDRNGDEVNMSVFLWTKSSLIEWNMILHHIAWETSRHGISAHSRQSDYLTCLVAQLFGSSVVCMLVCSFVCLLWGCLLVFVRWGQSVVCELILPNNIAMQDNTMKMPQQLWLISICLLLRSELIYR